jgi:two-component system, LuxR family, sensor kinase FixL
MPKIPAFNPAVRFGMFLYLALQVGLAATDLVDASVYPLGPVWNPSAGLALAALLLGGWSYLPLVVVGNVATGILIRGLGPAIGMADGLMMGLVFGGAAHLLGASGRLTSSRLDSLVRLLAGGIVAGGIHAVLRSGLAESGQMLDVVLRLWAGDVLGVVVVTPLLMVQLREGSLPRPTIGNVIEGASIMLTLWVDFGLHAAQKFRFFYLLFMPLVWIATRHGLRGATVGIALAQFGLLVAIRLVPLRDESLTLLQLIMLTLAGTTLLLGARVSGERWSRAELKDSETRLNAIVTTAPDGVLTIDQTGRIESANPACEELFAIAAFDLVGRNIASVLPHVDLETQDSSTETVALRHGTERLSVEVAVGIAQLSSRRLAVVVIRDISRRKASEARAWEHRTHLEQATRLSMSERLAAELAHQLNQPLAAAIGYCRACQRLLRAGSEPMATVIDAMDKAVAQAERAGEIIRSTRDFLASGAMRLETTVVGDLIAEAAGPFAPRYAAANVPLRLAVPAGLPRVAADGLQVEQVLVNLLQNALDAITGDSCPNGEVCVSAAFSTPGWVAITVADNGPGIAADVVERLFSPFTTTKATGMGMGLFIARSIIEAHGGTLVVGSQSGQSRPGRVTTFTFTLPIWTATP